MACLVFIGYCALEYTCGTWGSTFLVNAKGAAADTAARMVTFYYIGLALGRFLSGVLAGRLHSRQLVKIGQTILLAAIASLFLPLPSAFCSVSLFFIGLGNGPIFPNMLHLTPELFGKDLSQAVIGAEMATSYVGVLLAPALFGLIAQNVTAALFPVYLLVLYALMITGTAASVYKRGNTDATLP